MSRNLIWDRRKAVSSAEVEQYVENYLANNEKISTEPYDKILSEAGFHSGTYCMFSETCGHPGKPWRT